ncbi:hypothetical protein EIP86_005298 [Pleurotus ostreatoroseus]|nr:hypothetical protein EIP86_005298 [Pleurotus ostreatoroseus]
MADFSRNRITQATVLCPGERVGEGDTELTLDLLPPDLAATAFEKLRDEVQWKTMRHRVALIKKHVEKAVNHPVNHVLIQWYRSGADYISEHSDKTIDIVRGTKIVNVSLGAQRVMTLRRKKDSDAQVRETGAPGASREQQRVPLPHNSIFVLGLETNAKWLHAIRTDKRPASTKSAEELAENGERISLTFRHIGTFLTADKSHIFGQGAKGKSKEDARPIVRGGDEAEQLIIAFGDENHHSGFDWDASYGPGFDVVHFSTHDS